MAARKKRPLVVPEGMPRALPAGMRWRGSRIAVTGYDPVKGGGSVHLGTFPGSPFGLEQAVAAKAAFEEAKARRRSGKREWTCDEFVAVWAWTDHKRPAETTNLHYRGMTKPFGVDFAGVPLRDVTRPMMRLWAQGGVVPGELEWLASRWVADGEPLKRNVRGELVAVPHRANVGVVRTMFADAIRDGLCSENPASGLRLSGSRGRKDIVVLRPRELATLLTIAEKASQGHLDMAAMIAVAAFTGRRPGELYALRWEDLDFKNNRMRVERQFRSATKEYALPKHAKQGRTVVLPQPAVEWLSRLPRHVDGLVFHTKKGKPFSGRVHHYYWHPIRVAFGRPTMEFYELRHYCGTYLADRGISARDIAWQLGHDDGGKLAEELYIHTFEEESMTRIDAVWESAGVGL